jgi:predicted DNA-binding transcriptional regulator YafY
MQLGVGQELKGALLKLTASLPEARYRDRQMARQRIHLDASWWGQSGQPGPHLGIVQQALWQERRLRIVTRTHFGTLIEAEIEPLGLVAKANDWHLVALRRDRPRIYRVADLVEAEMLGNGFSRPPDFDLVGFWEGYCAQVEGERGMFWVTARISPALARELPLHLGDQARSILAQAGEPDELGWRVVRMPFEGLEQARVRLLGFGSAAEVLEPEPLRKSVIDFARQIVDFYH